MKFFTLSGIKNIIEHDNKIYENVPVIILDNSLNKNKQNFIKEKYKNFAKLLFTKKEIKKLIPWFKENGIFLCSQKVNSSIFQKWSWFFSNSDYEGELSLENWVEMDGMSNVKVRYNIEGIKPTENKKENNAKQTDLNNGYFLCYCYILSDQSKTKPIIKFFNNYDELIDGKLDAIRKKYIVDVPTNDDDVSLENKHLTKYVELSVGYYNIFNEENKIKFDQDVANTKESKSASKKQILEQIQNINKYEKELKQAEYEAGKCSQEFTHENVNTLKDTIKQLKNNITDSISKIKGLEKNLSLEDYAELQSGYEYAGYVRKFKNGDYIF